MIAVDEIYLNDVSIINNIGLTSESCRYLHAVCCMELGKFTEAEGVLIPNNDENKIPNGAAGVHLLGKIYQLSSRPKAAVEKFQAALRMDPLMWCSFEEMCSLAPGSDAQEYLQVPKSMHVPEYSNINRNLDTQKGTSKVPNSSPAGVTQRPCNMKTPVVGQAELPLDSQIYETPTAVPQAVQPPPMKKGPKDNAQYPVASESPTLLSGEQFLCGRKFLDEGTVRKVRIHVYFPPKTP